MDTRLRPVRLRLAARLVKDEEVIIDRKRNLLDRFGINTGDGLQLFWSHVGQRLDAGDASLGQLLQHGVAEVGGDVFERSRGVADQRIHLLFDLLPLLFLALDVNLPAQQFGGEADIPPLFADGERELGVIDDDLEMFLVAIHNRDPLKPWRVAKLFRRSLRDPRDTR